MLDVKFARLLFCNLRQFRLRLLYKRDEYQQRKLPL